MVNVNQIGWGSYKSYEGPYYLGVENKFVLPSNPTDEEMFLAVITATEGGSYSAINMYDSCILSAGLIQCCEVYFGVSKMIGCLAEIDPSFLLPLQPALEASKSSFRNSNGKWRFFFDDARGEANSAAKQQTMFFKNSNGTKGSWNEESKQHAKLWAACVASLWESDIAKACQTRFTAGRLGVFLTKEAKSILFGPQTPQHNNELVGAMRAAYYSFAANLPAVASEQLRQCVSKSRAAPWSEAWVVENLKQLTFGPNIPIYPGRYNKIRPVIETLYGVDLPNFSKDLAEWNDSLDTNAVPEAIPDFLNTKEVQKELIEQGYDLGPRKDDGVLGPKTRQAIMEFQEKSGLGADGVIGLNTRRALMESHVERMSNVR